MKRGLIFTSWSVAMLGLAGYGAAPASAASVFMWVADGTSLLGYSSGTNGTANSAVLLTSANAPSGGNFFSVAVAGTGNTQSVYVGDAGHDTVTAYSWNTSANTLTTGTTVTLSGGNQNGISPQEIALDKSGDLWALGFNGLITEYSSSLGAVINSISSISNARGMMIVGSANVQTVYVTSQGYGTGNVFDFTYNNTSHATTAPVTYATLGSATVGTTGIATGQMRGITEDVSGNIYYADTAWGGNNGYICQSTTCKGGIIKNLAGPNELITGLGTLNAGTSSTYDCDVIYEANYYSNTIQEFSTGLDVTGDGTHGHCSTGTAGVNYGNFLVLSSAFGTAAHVTGIALSPVTANHTIGGNEGPAFLDAAPDAPEPSTFAFAIVGGAILLIVGIRFGTRRLRAES